MKPTRRLRCLAALAWLFAGAASAGNFSVNPVRLELQPGESVTSLKIKNGSDRAQTLQVSLWRWSQQDGEDHYEPEDRDDGPIITPPLFRLAARDGQQIVRLGFDHPVPAGPVEQAWRVIIEEVPDTDDDANAAASIAMRLRISLPLLQRPLAVRQDLRWTGDTRHLVASNQGNVSERLDEGVATSSSSGRELARFRGPIYLLPGQQHRFELSVAAAPGDGAVHLSLTGTAPPPGSDLRLRDQ